MTLEDVLRELVQCLDDAGEVLVGREQVRRWPEGAVEVFVKAGWIKPAPPASTVECPGCEERCFEPARVIQSQDGQQTRAYVACTYRDDMGRVPIPLSHLDQWQITDGQVARWVSKQLGIKEAPKRGKKKRIIELGILRGTQRSGSVSLDFSESVCLKSADQSFPLIEGAFFEDGRLRLDQSAVVELVDYSATRRTADRYQPSTARRDDRKLGTAARHSAWRKEARTLRRDHPDKSERWIAQRIEKMDVAAGAAWETIRKNIRE
ncbi:MAG: hypothetical protein WBG92_22495 [Thiohalocapsa sp.]